MNAHIEHDLPLAVLETCRVRRTSPGATALRQDYERVNDVLAGAESEIRRSFLTAIGRRVDEEIGPVVHLVSAWNIDKARDLAWVIVETLWMTRDLALLSSRATSRCSVIPSAWACGSCSPPSPVADRRRMCAAAGYLGPDPEIPPD